jgi:BirA family biotin operon repressor/biotin-[acetyl-CoA-carboxylase] ligase
MQSFEQAIGNFPWKAMHYYEHIGSTNDEAARWIEQGAPDLAVVIANEQTGGRGRLKRRWYTPLDTALAFSVILKEPVQKILLQNQVFTRFTALGALAVCQVLRDRYQLEAEIKWPNDVLVGGKKIAGILAETHWIGETLAGIAIGIGINVAHSSIPSKEILAFPATCLEDCIPTLPDGISTRERAELLYAIVMGMQSWRTCLHSDDFIDQWEMHLAYRNQWVQVFHDYERHHIQDEYIISQGRLMGITPLGALRLLDNDGHLFQVEMGDISLRAIQDTIGLAKNPPDKTY